MDELFAYTHKELVNYAVLQLKRWNCYPICKELVTSLGTSEIPDAIAWKSNYSIMFECKASRADFLRDNKKPFRICNLNGVGDFRLYLTNENVIKSPEEMPQGWGCYEVINGKIRYKFGTRYDNAVDFPFQGNKNKEIIIIRSWIRRNYNKGENHVN